MSCGFGRHGSKHKRIKVFEGNQTEGFRLENIGVREGIIYQKWS